MKNRSIIRFFSIIVVLFICILFISSATAAPISNSKPVMDKILIKEEFEDIFDDNILNKLKLKVNDNIKFLLGIISKIRLFLAELFGTIAGVGYAMGLLLLVSTYILHFYFYLIIIVFITKVLSYLPYEILMTVLIWGFPFTLSYILCVIFRFIVDICVLMTETNGDFSFRYIKNIVLNDGKYISDLYDLYIKFIDPLELFPD